MSEISVSQTIREDYYRRLTTPTSKGDLFIDQYIQGSGNELNGKFWSKNSSSRLAFDLYSWIAEDKGILSFQFEKQLPGVICISSGTSGVPNMDVFFETHDTLVFIESKYTEPKASLKYKNGDLSKAYWYDGKYGRANFDLSTRFYHQEEVAKSFSAFCETMQKATIGNKRNWFDLKQETCHLFGILFYVLCASIEGTSFSCNLDKARQVFNGKKVVLCNNVWGLVGDSFEEKELPLVEKFKKESERLLNDIFNQLQIDCHFSFAFNKTQDIVGTTDFYGLDFSTAYSYGTPNRIGEIMAQYERQESRH